MTAKVTDKDQSNKVKISPLTNHRNTKKGVIKGGFDRTNLFQQAEKGFDKLFGYHKQLKESFEYCNTMENGSIDEQLKIQEREYANTLVHASAQTHNHETVGTDIQTDSLTLHQSASPMANQPSVPTDLGLSSALGIFTLEPSPEEQQQPTIKKKKKKKPKQGFRQS